MLVYAGDYTIYACEQMNDLKCRCHPWNVGELEGLYHKWLLILFFTTVLILYIEYYN